VYYKYMYRKWLTLGAPGWATGIVQGMVVVIVVVAVTTVLLYNIYITHISKLSA